MSEQFLDDHRICLLGVSAADSVVAQRLRSFSELIGECFALAMKSCAGFFGPRVGAGGHRSTFVFYSPMSSVEKKIGRVGLQAG
jgi:hypothetical protein